MKANLKGLSGIKGLMLKHGEKLGIGVVGLLAAYIVYSSLSLEPLSSDFEPADLSTKISTTKSTVDQRKWADAVRENPDDIRLKEDIVKRDFTVPAEPYATSSQGLDASVIPPTIPRTDPALLSAVDVEVTSGVSLFAFIDEAVLRERRLLAEAEAARKQQELDKQQRQQFDAQARGRTGPGEGMFGMNEMGEMTDPDHPNRRPVGGEYGMARPAGIPLTGDERVDRVHWACVVAKVPIKEQLARYKDAFENTRTGLLDGDFPQYMGYFVERAEVVPGQQLDWQSIQVHDAQPNRPPIGKAMSSNAIEKLLAIIQKEWPAPPMEVVDPRYMDPSGVLAYPLPPVVGREWGAEVTHPDIPLAVNAPPMEEALQPEELQPKSPADGSEEPIFSQANPMNQGMRPGGYGPGMGRGGHGEGGMMMGRGGYGAVGRPMGRMGMEGGGYGAVGRPMGRMGMEGGGGYSMMGRGAGGTMTALPRGVTDWLLRFFDFTVEPGKKYQYRVRLVLNDPNSNSMLATYRNSLDSAVLNRISKARKATPKTWMIRYAKWSEPSATVGIPLSGGVQVAEAKPLTGKFNDEPASTLMVTSIDQVEGKPMQTSKEKEFRRGAIANFVEDAEYVTIDSRWVDEAEDFNFMTGITVLDIKGGDSLARDQKAPARVLLMDPTGQLYVRNELDDLTDVKRNRELLKEPDRRDPSGRGGAMPYGQGMEGYGEGGGRVGRPTR